MLWGRVEYDFFNGRKFGFTYSNYDRPLEQFDMETQLVVDSVREKSSGQAPQKDKWNI